MARVKRQPKLRRKLPVASSRRKTWTLVFKNRVRVAGEECWGYCDYEKREIVISRSAAKFGLDREVLLHEVAHKICPWMAEDAVEFLAYELTESLSVCEQLLETLEGR